MRYSDALLVFAAMMGAWSGPTRAQTVPTPQSSANLGNPSVRLPTLELVAELGCPAPCLPPETFGSYLPVTSVAAGAGNLFAVLTREAPYVHVWNLDSGKSTVFGEDGRGAGQLYKPKALMFAHDTIYVVQGAIVRPQIKAFTLGGDSLGTLPTIERFRIPTVADLVPAPTNAWTGVATGLLEGSVVRFNRETGVSEILDVPTALIAGSRSPTFAAISASVAISDEGSVVIGSGETAYRLTLIPGDGSSRIEGGRAIAPSPVPNLNHFQMDAIRFDAKGRLWVRTTRGNRDTPRRTVFDLFGPKLEYLGEVVVDNSIGTYFIGPQLMVAQTSGQNSTTVMVWRIREP